MSQPSPLAVDHDVAVMIAPKCPLLPHDHGDLGWVFRAGVDSST
jgi:hypothetical protein